jgi:hypothetical protein
LEKKTENKNIKEKGIGDLPGPRISLSAHSSHAYRAAQLALLLSPLRWRVGHGCQPRRGLHKGRCHPSPETSHTALTRTQSVADRHVGPAGRNHPQPPSRPSRARCQQNLRALDLRVSPIKAGRGLHGVYLTGLATTSPPY